MRNHSLPLDPGGLGIFLLMAGALAPAPFETDFRARRDRRDTVVAGLPSVAKTSTAPRPVETPPKNRGETSTNGATASPRKLTLFERLDRWFWAQQQRDIEAYLARSADIHDLEERMRNLERGSWHRYN